MMKKYDTKDMKAAADDAPGALECLRECVTPGVGKGSWVPGDVASDEAVVKALKGNPYFKPTEVK